MIQRRNLPHCAFLAVLAATGAELAPATQDTRPASQPSAGDQTRNFSYSTPRMSVRGLVYDVRDGNVPVIHGQFMVHFNQPEWHAEYEPGFEAR